MTWDVEITVEIQYTKTYCSYDIG